MTGDSQVRICERLGVKFPWATRPYLLTSSTGKQAIVPDIMAMWTEAEKLLGRPCDPLALELIERLEAD